MIAMKIDGVKPFTKDPICPKCDAEKLAITHKPLRELMDHEWPEYLLVGCPRCGFKFTMETANQQKQWPAFNINDTVLATQWAWWDKAHSQAEWTKRYIRGVDYGKEPVKVGNTVTVRMPKQPKTNEQLLAMIPERLKKFAKHLKPETDLDEANKNFFYWYSVTQEYVEYVAMREKEFEAKLSALSSMVAPTNLERTLLNIVVRLRSFIIHGVGHIIPYRLAVDVECALKDCKAKGMQVPQ